MCGLSKRVASVDVPLGPSLNKLVLEAIADDHISDPAVLLQDSDMSDRIDSLLSELTDKQREVISCRFELLGHRIHMLAQSLAR